MESKSSSFKLKSHPDKLLFNHLKNVACLCSRTIEEKSLRIEKDLNKEVLRDVAYIIGATHDVGKATWFFQDYINEEDEDKRQSLKAQETTHHGLLSALFTYAILKRYIEEKNVEGEIGKYLPVISFIIVKRHHGDLLNSLDEIREFHANSGRIFEVVEKQLKTMNHEELQKMLDILLNDRFDLKIDVKEISKYILENIKEDIVRFEKRRIRNLKRGSVPFLYFITQFLYSTLLDADKRDAAFDGLEIERVDISSDIVDRYREIKRFTEPKKEIDRVRNDIYEEVVKKVLDLDLEDKILSLNVPTGSGKTLTSFSFALKLRSRLKREKDFIPRIIYALPFLSIIDQNYDVFEDLFTITEGLPDSRTILKHHHLAEVSYHTKEEDYEVDESLFLIEGWDSEIIVTTFWQLFHTLFSNKNRMMRKFNKLANSIIILDEVQSIPHFYWKLMREAIDILCRKFDSYVIFVTATQPLIFDEEKGEIKELAVKKNEYFRSFDRIKLIPILDETLSLDEFKALLEENLNLEPDKDFLIVLNTIRSATEVYQFIKELNLEETEIYYLSTNIIPKERLKRIREIKRSSKKRKVIVSTQLVEAGVDIDVDIVYRDFAPLDSINQVAGRCNRNYLKEKGKVFVFVLKDERSEFYKYIYDPFLVSKTLDLLQSHEGIISEVEFLDLNRKYFKKVREGMSDNESNKNLDCLVRLAFKDLNKDFKLIKEDYSKVDVFVELDENAKRIWQKYQEVREEYNLFERRKRFLAIKKDFYDYVISVPKKYANQVGFDEKTGIGYISKVEIDQGIGYDPETGFKRENTGGSVMIW
ncbi:MAG TPA: CRISPR-associated helicase Cas3' [Candidatus Syntrophoarchaeum butanivorans]|uniref:CRISPR-associated helicase Cas3 n=1 Tax=Candidatus Syntropharchaeum butanivorans TaxID=1839936 RepID=A0A7J2RZ83_9EURY|nr:CRISPR-associated helicase Cas3' [Candidatus Syntrophoarchaeum butanivorans]